MGDASRFGGASPVWAGCPKRKLFDLWGLRPLFHFGIEIAISKSTYVAGV